MLKNKPLRHMGPPDSQIDKEVLGRLETGCDLVGMMIYENGPPPQDQGWVAWEVRPAKQAGQKAITFESDYDNVSFLQQFVPSKKGKLVYVLYFYGESLLRRMRECNMGNVADYIETVRSGASLVVYEVGNPKGCYVKALGAIPTTPIGNT